MSEQRAIGGILVDVAAERYDAKYVGYYSIPGSGDGPFLVFWRPELNATEKKNSFDQYFGLFRDPRDDSIRIFNAKKIRDASFAAIEYAPGQFICSRSVHDMVSAPNGKGWLDGGPYYTRLSPDYPVTHIMKVVDGEEVFTPVPERVKERSKKSTTPFHDEGFDVVSEQPPALVTPAVPDVIEPEVVNVDKVSTVYNGDAPPDEKAKLLFLHSRFVSAGENGLAAILHDVGTFHIMMNQPVRYRPQLIEKAESDFRVDLIEEEFTELKDAIEANNIVKIADALTDIVYVTVGAMLHWGIPGDDCWDECQSSNMAKRDPVTGKVLKRADGKVLKPSGWQEPNFARALGLEA